MFCINYSDSRQNQALHEANEANLLGYYCNTTKSIFKKENKTLMSDSQWCNSVTHWQHGGLTWSGPRPRTWAAAIRSLFWLAYRKGGRDGKHENIGDGRWREEGIEHPGFSRTRKCLITQSFTVLCQTGARVRMSKASMPLRKASIDTVSHHKCTTTYRVAKTENKSRNFYKKTKKHCTFL